MPFSDMGLSVKLLKAIEDCGYTEPTPIQAQAIPHVLMMRDVVGLAQTGTGKTAGFILPMLEILHGGRARARMPRSLVLAPTRELAAQVAEDFDTYGKYMKLEMALLTGGTSMDEQIKKLDRGVDVLIATPGRLLDLFERGRILLSDIKILVIDEADRMLDMGFIPDIEKIVSLLSPMRQTLLFSATMAPEIKKITAKFLSNPREVSVAPPATTAKNVEQFIHHTSPRKKTDDLLALIDKEKPQNAFIFCNRKRDIGGVRKALAGKGYNVKELHGDMAQSARTKTLKAVKDGEVDFLVCSDVAGRGIDVDGLSHVFNFDVPNNADDYVHRIGRTGRAGKKGRAFTLVTKSDAEYLDAIQKLIKEPLKEIVKPEAAQPKAEKKQEQSKPKPKQQAKKEPKKEMRKNNKPSDQKGKGQDKGYNKTNNNSNNNSNNKRGRLQDKDDQSGAGVVGFGDEVPDFFNTGS